MPLAVGSPTALNALGQVVGGTTTPSLYVGGVTYDLGGLSGQVAGGTPVAINDLGQIVVNTSDGVYLLTPQSLSPVAVSPQSGNGASQTLLFTFTDPRGWRDLDVVNVLINNFLDGRSACYIAYSRPAGVLYLVSDSGGSISQGLTLGASGTVSNSQCSISASGSSATGSGTTLTLTLNITFTSTFAGNKIAYTAARDVAENNSGWVPLGVWQVPGGTQNTTTGVVSMDPTSGTGFGPTPYTFTFLDTKGYQDLGVENILINTALDGRHACYLAYSRPFNTLYLVNDNGDGLLPGKSLGASGTLSNRQCTVSWGSGALAVTGNNLALALNIAFSAGFGPKLIVYLAVRDVTEANNTGWQAVGFWTMQ
jgi:hypothetical protein